MSGFSHQEGFQDALNEAAGNEPNNPPVVNTKINKKQVTFSGTVGILAALMYIFTTRGAGTYTTVGSVGINILQSLFGANGSYNDISNLYKKEGAVTRVPAQANHDEENPSTTSSAAAANSPTQTTATSIPSTKKKKKGKKKNPAASLSKQIDSSDSATEDEDKSATEDARTLSNAEVGTRTGSTARASSAKPSSAAAQLQPIAKAKEPTANGHTNTDHNVALLAREPEDTHETNTTSATAETQLLPANQNDSTQTSLSDSKDELTGETITKCNKIGHIIYSLFPAAAGAATLAYITWDTSTDGDWRYPEAIAVLAANLPLFFTSNFKLSYDYPWVIQKIADAVSIIPAKFNNWRKSPLNELSDDQQYKLDIETVRKSLVANIDQGLMALNKLDISDNTALDINFSADLATQHADFQSQYIDNPPVIEFNMERYPGLLRSCVLATSSILNKCISTFGNYLTNVISMIRNIPYIGAFFSFTNSFLKYAIAFATAFALASSSDGYYCYTEKQLTGAVPYDGLVKFMSAFAILGFAQLGFKYGYILAKQMYEWGVEGTAAEQRPTPLLWKLYNPIVFAGLIGGTAALSWPSGYTSEKFWNEDCTWYWEKPAIGTWIMDYCTAMFNFVFGYLAAAGIAVGAKYVFSNNKAVPTNIKLTEVWEGRRDRISSMTRKEFGMFWANLNEKAATNSVNRWNHVRQRLCGNKMDTNAAISRLDRWKQEGRITANGASFLPAPVAGQEALTNGHAAAIEARGDYVLSAPQAK